MTDLELVLRAINLFVTGLVTGTTVVFQLSVVPVMRSWPESLSLRLHRDFVVVADPDRFIKPAGALSLITAASIWIGPETFTSDLHADYQPAPPHGGAAASSARRPASS